MTQAVAVEVDDEDLAQRVFVERLAGHSERAVARRHHLSKRAVRDITTQLSPQLDHGARQAELQLELARIDALTRAYFTRAMRADDAATSIFIRLSERRAALQGFDQAPSRTIDATALPQPRPTSTDLLQQALDRLAAEGQPARLEGPTEPVVEGPEPRLH